MKKSIVLILTVVLITAVSVGFFAGCGLFNTVTYDEAVSNLKGAEYTVTEMTSEQFFASDMTNKFPTITEAELERFIYANKGDNEIYLFFFVSVNAASNNYTFISEKNLQGGQSNEIVYLGTKQAIKDAGL